MAGELVKRRSGSVVVGSEPLTRRLRPAVICLDAVEEPARTDETGLVAATDNLAELPIEGVKTRFERPT